LWYILSKEICSLKKKQLIKEKLEMDSNTLYNVWCENAKEDKDLIEELAAIKGNEDEIYERFYKNLEFGTAGLRGVIGAGTNRMNIYVVRQATQGPSLPYAL